MLCERSSSEMYRKPPKRFLILLLAAFIQISKAGTGLPCSLTWIPAAFGSYPKTSVISGVNTIVSRIASTDQNGNVQWYGGHLSLPDGMSYAVQEGNEILESNSYSVLTNPLNCSLSWVEIDATTSGSIPANAVLVDSAVTSYIGRAPFYSTSRSGATLPGGEILFATYAQKIFNFKEYELLISEEPSLHVSLSKFIFTLDPKEIENHTTRQLISVDHLILFGSPRTEFNLEVEGQVDENFYVKEDIPQGWAAVSSADYNIVMWYGSSPIKQSRQTIDSLVADVLGIQAERERHLKFSANFTGITAGEKRVGCSFAVMLEDYEIPYTATAKFYPGHGQNQIEQDHVRQILIDTGRDDATFVNLPDGGVQATLTGWIGGRFVLRTLLISDSIPSDPNLIGYGPCDRHMIPVVIP